MISVSTYVLKASYMISNASWEAHTQNRIVPNESMVHLRFIHLVKSVSYMGPPGVLGIWGEWLFIFRELGNTGNYFQAFGVQVHSFGDLGIPAKKVKKNLTLKEKPSFCLIFFQKISSADPPHPLEYLNVLTFLLTC